MTTLLSSGASALDSFFDMSVMPVSEAKKHARLGASGAHRWSVCHLAPRLEDGLPDTSGEAADTGTICHDLGEKCLKAEDDFALFMALGKNAKVEDDGTVVYRTHGTQNDPGIVVTEDMIRWASTYVDFVRSMVMAGGKLLVEARLSIEHITGEPDAHGTSDSVLLFPPDELAIVDLKCGFRKVHAKYPLRGMHFETAPKSIKTTAIFNPDAAFKPNVQLVMYAEAARNEMQEQFAALKRIRYIIVQPTLDHVDEYVASLDEHLVWVEWLREQAENTRSPLAQAAPSPGVCQFCKAYPCSEAERVALEVAFESFDKMDIQETRRPSINELPKVKALLPMLRKYCDYIDARVRAVLESGAPVPGWKLVNGQQGDRKWLDERKAEIALSESGLNEADFVKRKIASPAQVEVLSRGRSAKLSKAQWEQMQGLITRDPPSGTHVVEESDPRPPVRKDTTAGFDFS